MPLLVGGGMQTVTWETTLFRKTPLSVHRNCLALIEAYAAFAPFWQRFLLATYVGIGPPLARCLGGNTKIMWKQADSIIADLFATSGMSAQEMAKALRDYVTVKREEADHLSFEKARESIYDQSFYPLVTHFTLAFQPSAVARMRFVRRAVEAMSLTDATVADLGCGSGAMLCEVLTARPAWTGCGLDISEAAIRYARRLAAHKGVAERARFQTGCISDLPYSNKSLDVVIASEVVEHLPEPERVFREFSRVLVPGGLLLVTMPVESHTPAHMNALNSAEELRGLCEGAGLTVSSVESRWHLSFGDDRKHIFAVAQIKAPREPEVELAHPLPLPQMSSAANSGMVSS